LALPTARPGQDRLSSARRHRDFAEEVTAGRGTIVADASANSSPTQ
jgi:hypothetical protein